MLKKLLSILLYIILYLPISTILFKIINKFLNINGGKRKLYCGTGRVIITCISVLLLSVFISIPVLLSDYFNILIITIGLTSVLQLCFQGSLLQKLSTEAVTLPLIIAINVLASLFNKSWQTYIFELMMFILIWLILRKEKLYGIYELDKSLLLLIDVICLAPLITILIIPAVSSYRKIGPVVFIAISCLITDVGVIVLVSNLIKNTKLQYENRYYRLQENYYKSMEEKQVETSKIYHDMSNHFQIISNCLYNKEYEYAQEYFEKLCATTEKTRIKNFCKNSMVNALLNCKYNEMQEYHIDSHFNIAINELGRIDDIDLCALLANSLDNAIESNIRINDETKRFIEIKACADRGMFSLTIMNNKNNEIVKKDDVIKTTKHDVDSHGYGLRQVKDIVERYQGSIEISYTEDTFTIIIAMLL